MKKVGKALLWVLKNIEEIISTTALCVMLCAIMLNVLLRYIFSAPTAWADELALVGMAYVTFLGGAAAYKRNLHFGIDILVDHLPAKGKRILRQIMTFAFIILFAVMTYLGFMLTVNAKKVMIYSGWSYKIMDAALPLGFASMTIYAIKFFIMSFKDPEAFDHRYETMYADDEPAAEIEEGGEQA